MMVVSSAKISEKHQMKLKNKYPNIDFFFYSQINEIEEINKADILITYGEDLTEEVLNNVNKLKWIQIISAGIDKLPFNALKNRNILITNARGIHHIPMAEYTFSVILQLARRTNDIYLNQLNKKWDRSIRVSEINNKTLGIIGLGSIGKSIARIARTFNMKVIGINTDGREVSDVDEVYTTDNINKLMSRSDFIVITIPLTKETHNIIGENELKQMKKDAYLINIARGEVVDDKALIDSLINKDIAGAVLDVFSEEPLPQEHPYWGLDNCIITPHLSGRSPKYMERALDIFMENLDLFLAREQANMKNLINLEREY